jgi:3-hydroxyisobutyrate dehydrogenase
MAKRVGIVGIGIMGTAMMRNLVTDGFEVVGYDIAEQAMARLAKAGGITAASPRDVAEKADIVITSVPSVDAFEQVIAGQGGIASSNGKGQIVIECSTLPIDVKARGEAQLAGARQDPARLPGERHRRAGGDKRPRRLCQRR